MVFNFKGAPATLSEEQLKKMFMKADVNNDNCLTWDEIKKVFKDLGSYVPDVRTFLAMLHADANGDGKIDMSELDELVKYARGLGFHVTDKAVKVLTA